MNNELSIFSRYVYYKWQSVNNIRNFISVKLSHIDLQSKFMSPPDILYHWFEIMIEDKTFVTFLHRKEFTDYKRKIDLLKSLPYTSCFNWELGPRWVSVDSFSGQCKTTHYHEFGKTVFIYSQFLPMINYYHTAVTLKEQSTSVSKKKTAKEMEVLEYRVRIGTSEDSIKAQILRELPEEVEFDDVNILIEEIF